MLVQLFNRFFTGGLLPEFEIICIIWEILNVFPSLLARNCEIYLNHSNIVSAMFNAAGLEDMEQRKKIFLKNVRKMYYIFYL